MEINNGNGSKARQQYFLAADALLKYFLGTSERISTMILCKTPDADLATTKIGLAIASNAPGSARFGDLSRRARHYALAFLAARDRKAHEAATQRAELTAMAAEDQR